MAVEDDELIQFARRQLRQGERELDFVQQQQLRARRARVMAHMQQRQQGMQQNAAVIAQTPLWTSVLLLAFLVLLGFTIAMVQQHSKVESTPSFEPEVLLLGDDMEFYQHLDFYRWLETQDGVESETP